MASMYSKHDIQRHLEASAGNVMIGERLFTWKLSVPLKLPLRRASVPPLILILLTGEVSNHKARRT
jgi:hypothetical protein